MQSFGPSPLPKQPHCTRAPEEIPQGKPSGKQPAVITFGASQHYDPLPSVPPIPLINRISYRVRAAFYHSLGQRTPEELRLWKKVTNCDNWREIAPLLALGVNPNTRCQYVSKTLLKEAIEQRSAYNTENQDRVIRLLLHYGADPSRGLMAAPFCDDEPGKTLSDDPVNALLLAYGAIPPQNISKVLSKASLSHKTFLAAESCKTFLAAGTQIRTPTSAQDCDLYQASLYHPGEIVETLIKYGASLPRDLAEVSKILKELVQPHRWESLKALLSVGVPPNIPLSSHFYSSEVPSMSTLLSEGIIRHAPPQWIETLLAAGANPNQPMGQGPSSPPLHLAISHENEPAINLLLKYGASLSGTSAFEAVVTEQQLTQRAHRFLAYGQDPNELTSDQKNSLLFYAAQKGNPKLIRPLLAAGADPMGRDDRGWTLLHWAAYYNDLSLARQCLTLGLQANDNQSKDHSTPLLVAASHGSPEFMALLLEHGADPMAVDIFGNTLLHYAVTSQDLKCLEKALERGVDPFQKNKHEETPLKKSILRYREKSLARLLKLYREKNQPLEQNLISTAIQSQNLPGLKVLLEAGLSPNKPDTEGHLPLSKVFLESIAFGLRINLIETLKHFGADPARLPPDDQLLTALHLQNPQMLINVFLKNQNTLRHTTLNKLFEIIDAEGTLETWKSFVPELLAIVDHLPPSARTSEMLNDASEAITRTYSYLYDNQEGPSVRKLERISLQNWGQLGTLGLSFSRWRFDAMTRWKGLGPQEEPSLLEASGLFTPSPPRLHDGTYQRSFTHTNPETGLCIELRRAYISISQPELGTLVIRNSSQVFGRDLLEEPAYYRPDKTYTGGDDLVNPKELNFFGGFESVLSKQLHQTLKQQKEVHAKIEALILAFEKTMDRYVAWKCDFKNGLPPPGFEALLSTALKSTEHNGTASPFGKQKNLRLAWVHPTKLPVILKALELTAPEIQAEARAFLSRRSHRSSATETYPHLIEFLSFGLRQGLELVLTPATDSAL